MSDADRQKWNARYRDGAGAAEPSAWLVRAAVHLPAAGRALDVAGGAGRNSVWLAARGLDTTLIDVSDEGLRSAQARAGEAGVSIATERVDCETDPLPPGPWDVIACFHYLHRPLFAAWPSLLAPGGVLVFVQPTARNLERHPRPPARFLLQDGELADLVQGLEIVELDEGWSGPGPDDRCEARLVARRPTS